MKANELLNTKKKKIVAGCVAGGAVLCGGLCYALFGQNEGQLVFTTHDLQVEFGNRVSTDVADYLDYDKVSSKKVQDIIKNTLAARAGFTKLFPNPPKHCLHTPIANTAPTIGI